MRTFSPRVFVLAALTMTLAAPVAADWLVTSDGLRIETRGPWEVQDKLVVFTSANGALTSLRLSEVDLEASRSATAAAAAPKPTSQPSKPQKPREVFVLTDADVGHVRPEPTMAERPTQDAPDESEAEDPADRLVVATWAPRDVDDGVALRGQIANVSSEIAASIEVVAVFRDAEGELLLRQPAMLSTTTLKPGQRSEFQVHSTDLFGYSTVDFEVDHFALLRQDVDEVDEDPASR
jgi:hypothetical protein